MQVRGLIYTRSVAEGSANLNTKMVMTMTVNVPMHRHLHRVVHLVKNVWQADELKYCNTHGGAIWRMTNNQNY